MAGAASTGGSTDCVRFLSAGQLAAQSFRITLSSTTTYRKILYESLRAGGKPSTWLPPEGLVEQDYILNKKSLKFCIFSMFS